MKAISWARLHFFQRGTSSAKPQRPPGNGLRWAKTVAMVKAPRIKEQRLREYVASRKAACWAVWGVTVLTKTRVETGCSGSFGRLKGNVAEELVEVGVRGSSLREFPPPRPVKCGTKPKHKERNQTHTRKVPSSPLNVRKADAALKQSLCCF